MDLSNGMEVPQDTLDAETKSFFESAPPLKNSEDISEKLKGFIERNSLPSGNFALYWIASMLLRKKKKKNSIYATLLL